MKNAIIVLLIIICFIQWSIIIRVYDFVNDYTPVEKRIFSECKEKGVPVDDYLKPIKEKYIKEELK